MASFGVTKLRLVNACHYLFLFPICMICLRFKIQIQPHWIIWLSECKRLICPATTQRVTRGGGGEVYPALFWNLEKSALIFDKNAQIVVIYVLNFSFKMQFLRVSRRKNRIFALWYLSLSCYTWLLIKVP